MRCSHASGRSSAPAVTPDLSCRDGRPARRAPFSWPDQARRLPGGAGRGGLSLPRHCGMVTVAFSPPRFTPAECDIPAMAACHVERDGKPEAGLRAVLIARIVQPHKRLENIGIVLRRHPGAIILDDDGHRPAIERCRNGHRRAEAKGVGRQDWRCSVSGPGASPSHREHPAVTSLMVCPDRAHSSLI